MLPFDIEIKLKSDKNQHDFLLGNLLIPAYGSITPAESMAITKLADEFDFSQATSLYQAAFLSIFIDSRCDPIEKLDELLLQVPSHILQKAYDWAVCEIREWAIEKPKDEEGEKKELTGEISSGDSSLDIPTTPDLALQTLETAQSI